MTRTKSATLSAVFTVLGCGLLSQASTQGADSATPAHGADITITVDPQPRQTFKGLGTSAWGGGDYMQLNPGQRAKLNALVWGDARFNTMRLWFHLKAYAPAPGQRNFKNALSDDDAALVRDALAAGARHVVLGPCDPPDYLLQRLPGEEQDGKMVPGAPHIKADQLTGHAAIIADFIHDLQEKGHITVEATGVQNEPNDINDCQFTPGEMVQSVKLLRAALDSRGLSQVRIIAPETVGCGGTWLWINNKVTLVNNVTPQTAGNALAYAMVDALKADDTAWKALGGIATHSYDGGATDRMADTIVGTDKDYWMTEFCVGGPEDPGDFFRGSVEAAAFLSDMNHRVNYWIHFIGYLSDDPHDNGTRLMAYYNGNVADDKWLKIFEPYYYLKQLGQAFDPGAIFRQSMSSLDGEMIWSRDKVPRLVAAAAQNPDGSWSMGILNYTSDHFPHDNWFDSSLSGEAGRNFTVTIKVGELARAGELTFGVHRIGPQITDSTQESATMSNGELTITVHPFELVTLRSAGQK
jgi:O-glycosyl hydrolase